MSLDMTCGFREMNGVKVRMKRFWDRKELHPIEMLSPKAVHTDQVKTTQKSSITKTRLPPQPVSHQD
jgi:hypothetical protein